MVLLEVVAEDMVHMVEVMVYLGEVALLNKEFLILVEEMILLEEDVVQLVDVIYEDMVETIHTRYEFELDGNFFRLDFLTKCIL